jgi:hypothetical protein
MPGLFVHAVRFTLSIKEHKKVSLTYWKSRGKTNRPELICYALMWGVFTSLLKLLWLISSRKRFWCWGKRKNIFVVHSVISLSTTGVTLMVGWSHDHLSGSNKHRQIQTLLWTSQAGAHQWRPVSLTNNVNLLVIMCFRTFVGPLMVSTLSVWLGKVWIDLKLSTGCCSLQDQT